MTFRSLLGHKNYRFFITGQGLSNIGTTMRQVAVNWLAYTLTESAYILGLVTFSRQFSAFGLGLYAGVAADQTDKKWLVQLMHALLGLSAFALSYIIWGGWISISLLLLFQILSGAFKGVETPSRQALINDIIPEKQLLSNAIAFNSTVFNTARIIGPTIAGLLIPFIGEGNIILIYGVLNLGVVLVFYLVKPQKRGGNLKKQSFKKSFSEGFKYTFNDGPIKIAIIFIGLLSSMGITYLVLLPILVGDIFQLGAYVYGYMTSAIGAGAILGGLFLANLKTSNNIAKWITLGATLITFGLFGLSVSRHLWLSLCVLLVIGFGRILFYAGTNTLLQMIAPDDKRGRVLSFYITIHRLSVALGGIAIGILADWIGVLSTFLVQSFLCLGATFWFFRRLRKMPQLKNWSSMGENE